MDDKMSCIFSYYSELYKKIILYYGPQFIREDDIIPTKPQKTKEWFDNLKNYPDALLKEMGCQQWNGGLWLYPKEWYDSIPDGYEIIDIFNEKDIFEHGQTDDDVRFGALAYGFIKNNNKINVDKIL